MGICTFKPELLSSSPTITVKCDWKTFHYKNYSSKEGGMGGIGSGVFILVNFLA